ncbi:MAG: tyrosine decarboxylase MnfA [Thermoplasmata archaeon M9B1D]|nr:MAG: tyrosine decarboxylase MnfA [Thermoplasmata archaeon M9B1D]PNX51526.1 MAG: tyrosine decarboxylase MnfA [Thermoplasmata archaeon M8B2D]
MKNNKKQNKYHKIIKDLEKYQSQDFTFSSGRILGSMCTQPHPIAKKAYMKFLETNLGDPYLFPGSKKIEAKYLSFISKLLNAPKNATGVIGSGGTESNISAIWLAKNLSGKKEVIIPKNAHFSFQKIASLMDIKLIPIPLTENYYIDVLKTKKKIGNNTAAIVGIAGSTELGTIDPISDLSDLCIDEKVYLHVDAAFGGYIIPFLRKLGYDVFDFDFKLPAVSSITIDAHKMGRSAIPLGTLFVRNKKWLDEISVETPYISSKKQAGILATRSCAPVAAAYAVAEYLGIEGYTKMVKNCMNIARYTKEKIEEIGLELLIKPTMNVLAVKIKNPLKVEKILTGYGWKVNKMERLGAIRIVVMPHVTKKVIDEFIPVFKKVCIQTGEKIS